MSVPDLREVARQRLADNLARRSILFKLTLGAGVSLFVFGLLYSVAIPYSPELTLRAFGTATTLPLPLVTWAVILYLFSLAFRAIWLPDEKLKRAARNLFLMSVGVGIVTIAWAVSGGIRPRS